MSRVRIEEVPPQTHVSWTMAAMCSGRDDQMDILNISEYATQNWRGTPIKALVQASPKILGKSFSELLLTRKKPLKFA